MSYIEIVSINEEDKWDKIVRGFIDYDVNYLNGYAKAFYLHGEGEPFLFYYNDGITKAINVVMKRDIAKSHFLKDILPQNTFFDISTPYGYGGFWIKGEEYETVMCAYDNYCREQGFVSEFVRFHLLSNYRDFYDGSIETHTKNIVRTLDLSFDELLMDFEHKVRKNLKKANKYELEVEIDYIGEKLDEFLDIYYGTMERANAKDNYFFTREFFEKINEMKDNYVYIHVLYQGKVISTELVLYGSENCYSFLGGTNPDYFDLRPNDFLKYEIIKWAKEKGLRRFILGGGYGTDDGIFKYKKSFAPHGVYDFYVGKKIFSKEKYDELVKIRVMDSEPIEKVAFFPTYRA
ncbi:GNAT family N-acetyltransferase [Proteiniclasticum ruminis]|uniref:Acetyltransferase (GNAT) domain-containing protein n=1 Tax=Proteiniclasticum ruminis TaxID=398199 RepID=A0A1G8SCQ2_9CLOT|nr:GNAT family N-acetyltransferase [Proteiniclasticum ruminis]SDJ26954.1 Acetyltransferase (GNAT) domain-containing protein [Proteiniclasticum ruminis]